MRKYFITKYVVMLVRMKLTMETFAHEGEIN